MSILVCFVVLLVPAVAYAAFWDMQSSDPCEVLSDLAAGIYPLLHSEAKQAGCHTFRSGKCELPSVEMWRIAKKSVLLLNQQMLCSEGSAPLHGIDMDQQCVLEGVKAKFEGIKALFSNEANSMVMKFMKGFSLKFLEKLNTLKLAC